ncbi:hypothetical protein NDU88_003825 [Pleurodeles waltl]|uniref:Uncharacterized protein n=1 Tax=Pleurodeles waltl TaxID=8319 RepID=A0AAV7TQ52_PLEWA|nr:hypothetical protein NDU88_003825 [Pleurodeles waltl]
MCRVKNFFAISGEHGGRQRRGPRSVGIEEPDSRSGKEGYRSHVLDYWGCSGGYRRHRRCGDLVACSSGAAKDSFGCVASEDFSRLMEVEEGAQPFVIMAMEKVGAEVRVEETVVLDKGEKIKDQCTVSAVNSESQEEQSDETPPVTMVNNNHAPGISQLLRMEDGEGTVRFSPMEEMITKLAEEIKKGFSVSKANQASIKEACEILETKFDLLAKRMQFLEETVESLKEDVVQIKHDLRESRACEQDLQDKLERLENAARRNNLRILNIPAGVKGNDIKSYFASLIKNTLQLEETEQDIAADIQRIHRDPFRRDPGRKKTL